MMLKYLAIALTGCSLFVAILSGAVSAQETYLPGLFRVTGVAADDVLNVREGPGTGFAIVDTLTPNATGIEVVNTSDDGRWALLNTRDWSGYAALRFLQRLPAPPPHVLPLPLNCSGTEPFWGLSVAVDGSAAYYDPEVENVPFTLDWSGPAAARAGLELGMRLRAGPDNVHAVLVREECSDGMSDYAFGLSVRAIFSRGGQTYMVEGCCSIR